MRVLLLLVLAYCSRLHAQDSTILIRAGKSVNESVAITDLYQYAEFSYGKVFFKAGDSTNARFNYHRFLDAMLFLDLKGDTLKIANGSMIRFIRINNDLFYYDDKQGFVNLIKDTDGIKLAAKRSFQIKNRDKIGAYGVASPTSSISTYSTLISQTNVYNLVAMEDITMIKNTEYYFGDKYNHFVPATRKNLLQQFSKQSKALNAYLKDNNIDLNKQEDLEKLLAFLASL
jgi:hypothetical protein